MKSSVTSRAAQRQRPQLSSADDAAHLEEIRHALRRARLAIEEAESNAGAIVNPYYKGQATKLIGKFWSEV